jgi:uncharacterized protein involved in exopolysaccharide biosynthesis
MTQAEQQVAHSTQIDRIDFLGIFRALWAGKTLIAVATLVAGLVALTVAFTLPNVYRAEALLVPNQDRNASSISALSAQYGGLASLAGIDIASKSSDRTALGLEILKSRKFLTDFIENHEILVPLMASDGWDTESKVLEIDADVYDTSANRWVREVRAPKTPVPSLQEAYKTFSEEIFTVTQDKKTGFVTIVIEHHSPIVAKQWVDWLVQDLNATVMRHDVTEAEQAIEYLEKQIAATSLSDLQKVFFRLIEEQTKTVMLAKVSPEYLFRTIDPAVEPEQKASPKRALITVLGLIVGAVIGVFAVLVIGSLSSARE